MSTVIPFLQKLASGEYRHVDRAVAALWWYQRAGMAPVRSARKLADNLEDAGYPKQNVTRLSRHLTDDPRVSARDDGFRLNIAAKAALDDEFEELSGPQTPEITSSVLPAELFIGTRGYLEKVVVQANAAYDNALFDCCAVMLRRLAETLIIEVYEHQGREEELKRGQENYPFFSTMLGIIKNDGKLSLSRGTKSGLDDFKRLGDASAHNRRYNAVQDDIDRVRDGLRVAAEELLHLADMR